MSDSNRDRTPRTVNPMLGSQPKIGPLPANQLLPWMLISGVIWFLAQMISLPFLWTILLVFWGDITWWLLTGKTPWKFLSKFISVPTLTRGRVTYCSIYSFSQGSSSERRNRKSPSKRNPNR